jgi:hypothetical protein
MHASSAQAAAYSNLMSIEAYLASKNLTVGKKPTTKVIEMDAYRPKHTKHMVPVNPYRHTDEMSIGKEEVKYNNRMFKDTEDDFSPVVCSVERTKCAPTIDQKHHREMRNRTHKVICSGKEIEVTRTYVDYFTKNEETCILTETVGRISYYRYHDSHGSHGRKPKYKDLSSGKFRVKTIHNFDGNII